MVLQGRLLASQQKRAAKTGRGIHDSPVNHLVGGTLLTIVPHILSLLLKSVQADGHAGLALKWKIQNVSDQLATD